MKKTSSEVPGVLRATGRLFEAEAVLREAAATYAEAEGRVYVSLADGQRYKNSIRRSLRNAAIAYANVAATINAAVP